MSPVSGRKRIHMKTILLARSSCAFPPFSYSPSCSSISHCLRFTCHLFDTFWLDLIISACLLHCQYFCNVSFQLFTTHYFVLLRMEGVGALRISLQSPEQKDHYWKKAMLTVLSFTHGYTLYLILFKGKSIVNSCYTHLFNEGQWRDLYWQYATGKIYYHVKLLPWRGIISSSFVPYLHSFSHDLLLSNIRESGDSS